MFKNKRKKIARFFFVITLTGKEGVARKTEWRKRANHPKK